MVERSFLKIRFVAGVVAAVVTTPATARAGEPSLEGPREELAALDARSQPPPTPESAAQWNSEQRRLQAAVGVSAGLMAAFLLTGLLVLTVPPNCSDPDPDFGCGEGYGRAITAMIMFPAAAVTVIPTAVYGVRLSRHNERRPVARLQLTPGGFALRF